MTREKFLKLKAGLLCHGAALSENARSAMMHERPKLFKKGFIDAVNMNIGGSNICVSIAENFAENSELLLDKDADGYYIMFDGERADVRFFIELPKTGTVVDDLVTLHADGCINIWPSTNCCYDTPELKCKFCSLLPETQKPIDPDVLCVGLKKLLAEYNGTLNFSGATYKSPDIMVEYWCELCEKIREFSDCPIAVEFAPPKNLDLIDKLKESGATVAIMNIEIVGRELRREICPGKSGIPLEHYHKAMERAVEVFGYGKVSSVMIGGIQPWEDIKEECETLCKMGVFPTIMPFRPLDDCTYSFNKACDVDELIEMSEYLGELLRKYKLAPQCQPGCTACGGCSIENDCYIK